ncbi:hypothetical protein EDC04DRAFT_2934475 [Pisolithus marmoratus]|nr:hypothetical protein EDC04DRAFT_2934475 [Pisolithus marmoratus]
MLVDAVNVVTKTRAEKWRDVLVGLAIGLNISILEMNLHYIIQRYRLNIFKEIECYLTTYNIPPPHALVQCWPTMIGVVSAAYCSTDGCFLQNVPFESWLFAGPSSKSFYPQTKT